MSNNQELLPCPHCGGKPTIIDIERDIVRCFNCPVTKTREAWNTRAKAEAQPAVGGVDEYKVALEIMRSIDNATPDNMQDNTYKERAALKALRPYLQPTPTEGK